MPRRSSSKAGSGTSTIAKASRLGYPISEEISAGGKRVQYFERGAIREISAGDFAFTDEQMPERPRESKRQAG